MSRSSAVKVVGPLAVYATGFARELKNRGYKDLSVAQQLRFMAHMSRWLEEQNLQVTTLSREKITAFCASRRAAGYTGLRTMQAAEPLQEFLHGQGVLPSPPSPQPAGAEEQLLERYRDYLLNERGLVEQGVKRCVQAATRFLADQPGLADGASGLGAREVNAYCVRELPGRASSSAKNLAAALRSFLRFLHLEGIIEAPLDQAVPPVANRKGAGLPPVVPWATLNALLASCDRRTTKGRRDYAIMMLLGRLGLRAGEVARLSLDDIDWRIGELLVHGKGGRDERLPLPRDVGAALAGYLRRGRPRTNMRTVFLRAIAPAGGLSRGAVSGVVYAACARSGVSRIGAHRLRHSCATQMLDAGASLFEIGQALRHSALATTAIYAKVDFVALRPLAQPWPGGVA